jgi:hypothetical protein
MGALASTDVTLTIVKRHRVGMLKEIIAEITFGNDSATYPTGGVPLPDLSEFYLKSVYWADLPMQVTMDGYKYLYDKTNHTIRKYQTATHTHNLLYIGGITATEPVAIAGGDTLGKNAATNRTIAGADSATKGGVVALAAGPLTEVPTTHAPAETTLRLKLQGR